MKCYRLDELVVRFGGEIRGAADTQVCQIASLSQADSSHLSFVTQEKWRDQLALCRAAAFILKPDMLDATDKPCIVTPNPYAYFAKVSALFNPPPEFELGIAPTAVIHPSAQLGNDVRIAANAVIERDVQIGAGSRIGAGTVIGVGTVIAKDALIYANVTIYHHCVIGERVILHSGCVIGADGFGLAQEDGCWIKIPQIGRVVIGDDVEIGANTTVDRGALDDTIIHHGVKLDNQIQVAHNVHIGEHTAIAACTGIAGSAHIGAHCTLAGAAMVLGHLSIADHVNISSNTLINKSLSKAGTYTATMPFVEHSVWLKNAVHLRHLDRWVDRIKQLEYKIALQEHTDGST